MTKLLITPQQAAQLAFGGAGAEAIAAGFITPTAILAAQRRYIMPATGERLYSALQGGSHETLLEEYVRPPLAMFLRAMTIPELWAQTGRTGVVRATGQGMESVSESEMLRLVRGAKSTARTLLRICTEHIESHPESYPEYEKCPDRGMSAF